MVLEHAQDGHLSVFVHPALWSLLELQDAVRWREIEIELQSRKQRQTPVQLQPTSKWFKVVDSTTGSHRGRTCGNCGKVHDGGC